MRPSIGGWQVSPRPTRGNARVRLRSASRKNFLKNEYFRRPHPAFFIDRPVNELNHARPLGEIFWGRGVALGPRGVTGFYGFSGRV